MRSRKRWWVSCLQERQKEGSPGAPRRGHLTTLLPGLEEFPHSQGRAPGTGDACWGGARNLTAGCFSHSRPHVTSLTHPSFLFAPSSSDRFTVVLEKLHLGEEASSQFYPMYMKAGASLVTQQKRIYLPSRRYGFSHWVGKIPWRRAWQPTPVSLPGESHGQRSLVGYSPRGRKESDMTE